jgi:hypothetical protein
MAFWVKQVYRMVGTLAQTVQYANISASLYSRCRNGVCKKGFIYHLAAGERKQQTTGFYGLNAHGIQSFVTHHSLVLFG